MQKVLEYLMNVDPEMANIVREDYSCFGQFDPQTYGILVHRKLIDGCRDAAIDALHKITERTSFYAQEDKRNGIVSIDDAFLNEGNALVVVNAEKYYCALFDSSENTWNIRGIYS